MQKHSSPQSVPLQKSSPHHSSAGTSVRRVNECRQKRCKTVLRKLKELNQQYNIQVYLELQFDGKLSSFSSRSDGSRLSADDVVSHEALLPVDILIV